MQFKKGPFIKSSLAPPGLSSNAAYDAAERAGEAKRKARGPGGLAPKLASSGSANPQLQRFVAQEKAEFDAKVRSEAARSLVRRQRTRQAGAGQVKYFTEDYQ